MDWSKINSVSYGRCSCCFDRDFLFDVVQGTYCLDCLKEIFTPHLCDCSLAPVRDLGYNPTRL